MNSLDWKNADPTQKVFWNLSNVRIAWNTITPMLFDAAVAGSEFLVYNAAKYYIGLEVNCYGNGVAVAAAGYITFYDPADAISLLSYNNNAVWDTTAAALKYICNPINAHNIAFSRVVVSTYTRFKFIGYKLTIV